MWPRLLVCLLACALGVAARAEEPGGPPPDGEPAPSVFQQIFPHPSGVNGYEEIVAAGERAQGNQALAATQEPGATLAMKRQALADPNNVEALRLLRIGLEKPLRSPDAGLGLDAALPRFGLLRQLARLLVVEQYVLLADGRTGAALGSLRDGLRVAYLIKGERIIGGLVGVAMESILLNGMAGHIEQLSAPDCDRLVALAKERLAAPDPMAAALEAERAYTLAMMEQLRRQPSGPTEPDAQIEADPGAVAAFAERFAAVINLHFTERIVALRLPPWKRREPKPIEDGSPEGRVARMLLPVTAQAMTSFTRSQARMQLLGVHAALRRFRWEHERLPDSLAELRLGDLAVDPFTGQSLVYRRTGPTAYELSSAGAPGEQKPITIP
jgi:hypothetical protein